MLDQHTHEVAQAQTFRELKGSISVAREACLPRVLAVGGMRALEADNARQAEVELDR